MHLSKTNTRIPQKMKPARRLLLASAAALPLALAAAGPAGAQDQKDETKVSLKDQTGLAVTIYRNFALVRDSRTLTLKAGENKIAFEGVSARMQPQTAILSGVKGTPFTILEQNFNFDIMNQRKMLEKSLGQEISVRIYDAATRGYVLKRAKVLSVQRGIVVEMDGKIYTSLPGRAVFDRIPPNLRSTPTLVVEMTSKEAGSVPVELSYLTSGLSWRSDYVALLSDDESEMDLKGWVTLTNRSGTSFKDTKMQLVAGSVRRVGGGIRPVPYASRRRGETARKARVTRRALFDYHIYTLDRKTTILNNQTKQVSLMEAGGVTVAKEYRFSGYNYTYRRRYNGVQKGKAQVWIKFANAKASNLGLPLPAGTVRVYKRDKDGNAIFVGSDNIAHTAENEKVGLRVGNAFDVSAERIQTDYRRETLALRSYESAYRITLKNAKDKAVTVIVSEPVPGDWTMISESQPHSKVSSGRAEWRIAVPAKGETVLTYRVRVTY